MSTNGTRPSDTHIAMSVPFSDLREGDVITSPPNRGTLVLINRPLPATVTVTIDELRAALERTCADRNASDNWRTDARILFEALLEGQQS